MSPQQLHQTAVFIRERYSPPEPMMTPGKYVSHEAMHALADALDRTGDVAAETAVIEAPRPALVDDPFLRAQALDLALKMGAAYSTADTVRGSAETFLAFLRGEGVQPAVTQGPVPAAAPEGLHEAIDRAWVSIVEDGDRLALDSDGDEDVLEKLRTLGDAEIARAGFTLAIVRALAQSVRADRGSEAS